jgi:type IV secretion system protein VirB9
MRFSVLSTLALLLPSLALAQTYSASYDESTRIRSIEYRENLVLRAVGYPDYPIVIELDAGEPIESAAGGKIANWEVETRGSRLYARPLDGARPTTVLIASKTRSYVLDLVPGSRKGAPTDLVSKIVVRLPAPPQKPPEPVAEANAIKEAATPLSEALSAARNDHYSLEAVSETIDIRPREVFDDGRFTYFSFPENLPIPTIYKSAPGSQDEWLVNSHRDGDYIVVHGVGASWNLRLSGSVLGVFNDAYDPVGVAARAGATITGVKRELK